MSVSRRDFLTTIGAAAASAAFPAVRAARRGRPEGLGFPDPARHWRGDSSVGAALRQGRPRPPAPATGRARPRAPAIDLRAVGQRLGQRYRDLRRRFVFEYYPWYGTSPWRHWDQWGRTPPVDLAATSMPRLGPYDSRSIPVIEQHARWIADAGGGAVNLSWWGPGDATDLAVHTVMDVMRAHDIQVAFHLEPYRDDRSARYVDDIVYLLREYGDRRHWDAFLLLEHPDGTVGPVFKSFRTILPSQVTDCHGVVYSVPDYTSDGSWRRETDGVRDELRHDFDRLILLADSLDFGRTRSAGFDGIAIYDNYVRPASWPALAAGSSQAGLLFSFNTNPGFDGIVLRDVEPGSCYVPPAFEPPGGVIDWSAPGSRSLAMRLSRARIVDSMQATLGVQTDAALEDDRRGFFLVYVNSFNEWHEGHQFEPMKDYVDLTPAEVAVGYHNPPSGSDRLEALTGLLSEIIR